jgi:hypothetical protein
MTLKQFAVNRLTELGYTQVPSSSRKYIKFATPAPNKTYYWVGNRSVRVGGTIAESHSVTDIFARLKVGVVSWGGAVPQAAPPKV